jgi:hypothetical protein
VQLFHGATGPRRKLDLGQILAGRSVLSVGKRRRLRAPTIFNFA